MAIDSKYLLLKRQNVKSLDRSIEGTDILSLRNEGETSREWKNAGTRVF